MGDAGIKPGDHEKVEAGATRTPNYWALAMVLGVALGLLLIGPDHLGTLMALSTLTTGFSSFKVGFSWGVGHSVGIILIMPLFYLLKSVGKTWNFSMEDWEYAGDYCIGASMILLSLYFILYEHHYIEQKSDGTFHMKVCEHCDLQLQSDDRSENEQHLCLPCAPKMPLEADGQAISQSTRLRQPTFTERDWHGALVGILQGLCCPTGLMGIGFMGKVSTHYSLPVLCVFAAVFLVTSGVASGLVSFGWGMLSSRGLVSCISPRMMYLASCIAIGVLGLTWIVANATGVLHYINGEILHP